MTTVADLMTPAPFVVRPSDFVGDTRHTMLQSGVHCVPVTDDDGHAVGIITSWDLVEEYAPQDSVRNVMSTPVRAIGAHQFPSEAANEMRTNFIHHLVVIDANSTIVGVVSSLDLLGEIV